MAFQINKQDVKKKRQNNQEGGDRPKQSACSGSAARRMLIDTRQSCQLTYIQISQRPRLTLSAPATTFGCSSSSTTFQSSRYASNTVNASLRVSLPRATQSLILFNFSIISIILAFTRKKKRKAKEEEEDNKKYKIVCGDTEWEEAHRHSWSGRKHTDTHGNITLFFGGMGVLKQKF